MELTEESKQRFRQRLLEMRQELFSQIRGKYDLTRKKDYSGDMGDHAAEDMASEYLHLLGERLRQRLLLVDDALDAIEHEEYGLCEECEEPINEKRLLLMPFTRLCVSCQAELERQARVRGNPCRGLVEGISTLAASWLLHSFSNSHPDIVFLFSICDPFFPNPQMESFV